MNPPMNRRYAGFWIRGVALVIDNIIMMIASQLLTYLGQAAVYAVARISGSVPPDTFGTFVKADNLQMLVLASLVITLPYEIAFHHYRGATPGKAIFKIEVIDEGTGHYPSWGQATGRFLATMLSGILAGAGYLMAAFNHQKKALHDTLAGTVSVYRDGPSEESRPVSPQA